MNFHASAQRRVRLLHPLKHVSEDNNLFKQDSFWNDNDGFVLTDQLNYLASNIVLKIQLIDRFMTEALVLIVQIDANLAPLWSRTHFLQDVGQSHCDNDRTASPCVRFFIMTMLCHENNMLALYHDLVVKWYLIDKTCLALFFIMI